MSNSTLPDGPLYDPKSKIRKFRFEEDFENIRFNLLGTGVLYEDPTFYYHLEKDQEWRRPKEICRYPLFIDGKPDRFDALQGIGDCWLVSGIEAITLNDKLIKHVVPQDQSFAYNYVGAFHFRIWQIGNWYDVVVDDRLPVFKSDESLCNIHSVRGDVFWAALLEKAYAKISSPGDPSYENLKTGGSGMTGIQDLSGGIVEWVKIHNPPSGITVKWLLKEVFSKNALIVCNTLIPKKDIFDYHTYIITKLFTFPEKDSDFPGLLIVRLMNPWGYSEWEGDWSDFGDSFVQWMKVDRKIRKKLNIIRRNDGEFWMNETDFVKNFDNIYICHLGPGQYLESRHSEGISTWRTTTFSGEWVKRISAGGKELINRHKNPQYRLLLKRPKNDSNEDGLCTVVIELAHRSKSLREIRPLIVFFIYSLSKVKNLTIPLKRRFFVNNDPLNKPDFSASDGRAFLTSMKLEPGKYCIVPCTYQKDQESRFLLRVFSESRVALWEYDTKISKSSPTEEEKKLEPDEGLKNLFYDIAQGQDVIDWIGLNEILEICMSPKRPYFGMIALLLYFFWYVFEIYILHRSSYKGNDEVVFTKDDCRSMIDLLDDNHSGKLSFSEFSYLWSKICFWTKVYEQHRDEAEGYLTVAQLRDALSSIGYGINKRTLHSLSYVYANERGIIFLTDFIICSVTLETVLALFENNNLEGGINIKFTLEKWVKNTLFL